MLSANPTETRLCKKHGKQSLTHYYLYQISSSGKTRTQYECKLCAAIKRKKRYKKYKAWYRAYGRKWQKKNKKKTRAYKAQHRTTLKEYIVSYLQTHSCVDCDEADIRVLEFDHVRGNKSRNISFMVSEGYSLLSLEKEIAKCDVRCANCHRRKTVETGNYYRSIG